MDWKQAIKEIQKAQEKNNWLFLLTQEFQIILVYRHGGI